MDRRQFVAGASVGVVAAASAFPKPAIAQGVRELKMVDPNLYDVASVFFG